MTLTPKQIVEDVKSLIDIRNRIKAAITAKDHIIVTPAVAATDTTPAVPESKQTTGQLPTACGFAHALTVNLIAQLKLIGGDAFAATVKELEQSLNAPLPAPAPEKPEAK